MENRYRIRSLPFFITLLLASWAAGSAHGATNLITGEITADATWSGTNLLRGTVTIRSNVVVTIEPGTRMLMNTNAVLSVSGRLLANGTSNAPIVFTRATTTAPWSRILFVQAAPSLLRHCIIEYANSVGDHQSYYPNNCNPPTFAARTYREAVVCLAGHLDIDGCLFRNLPSAGGEGDAIAIISDYPDPTNTNLWNSASGTVRNSQFLDIGQGVHSRYAYVLIENCLFRDKNGDNDHVDLYGESNPPPLIQNNLFFPDYEDAINPTRCSAIIIGNVVAGSPDHGIVLRDKCSPIVMNNLVYNCRNGGISVQNQCDALLINNTIVNCGIGLRLFDHTTRWGQPYCLFPGSGRVTAINTILWDCPSSITLTDTTYTGDPGSHARVFFSNVEGGQASASVSANSTLLWGAGNINLDPIFLNPSASNYFIGATSPCIDAGTNVSAFLSADYQGIPRPLDGNGDGNNGFDIGAREFLLATADSNQDGIPDGWTWSFRLNPTDPNVAAGNPDNDPHTTFQEWLADTVPTNAASFFRLNGILVPSSAQVSFQSSTNRRYSLYQTTELPNGTWSPVPGQQNVPGLGGPQTLAEPATTSNRFYRVQVNVP